MNGRSFDSIDKLRADIEKNYNGSKVGKYRVVSVDYKTDKPILGGLLERKKNERICLILEEIDG